MNYYIKIGFKMTGILVIMMCLFGLGLYAKGNSFFDMIPLFIVLSSYLWGITLFMRVATDDKVLHKEDQK